MKIHIEHAIEKVETKQDENGLQADAGRVPATQERIACLACMSALVCAEAAKAQKLAE